MPPNNAGGTAEEIPAPHPYKDFKLNGTDKDVMSWIRGRLDGSARSVELTYKTIEDKQVLVGRVWLRNV